MVVAPVVSVVMPAHNAAATVRRAVDSVLAQTVENLEVVVVDDGSTDDTSAAARAIGDPRVLVITLPNASGGPADPRNRALAEARGEWVAFLDADDEWLPGKIEAQMAAVDDETALVYSRCLLVDRDAEPVDYHDYWSNHPTTPSGDCAEVLIQRNFVPILTAMVHRSWVDRVGGFDPRLAGIEDHDYWLRVALSGGSFAVSPAQTAVYYVHDGNLTHRVDKHRLRARMFSQLAATFPEHRRVLRQQARSARRRALRRQAFLARERLFLR